MKRARAEYPDDESLRLIEASAPPKPLRAPEMKGAVPWRGPASAKPLLEKIIGERSTLVPVAYLEVDLPAADGALREGELHSPHHEGAGAHEGRNSFLRSGWLPPDPPTGHCVHRYAFQLFALGPGDAFPDKPGRSDVLRAVEQRGLASGLLVGTYEREGSEKIRTAAALAA